MPTQNISAHVIGKKIGVESLDKTALKCKGTGDSDLLCLAARCTERPGSGFTHGDRMPNPCPRQLGSYFQQGEFALLHAAEADMSATVRVQMAYIVESIAGQ